MSPRLLGVGGPFQGTAVPLSDKEISIGRDPANDFWVADGALSRRHCVVTNRTDQFILRDLGSKNGTFVNRVPITEQALRDGDHITMGDSVFVFQVNEEEAHPEKSRVEFTETGTIEYQFCHHLRDSECGTSMAMPESARIAQELDLLLKIASSIGSLHDQESLQWQLLNSILDLSPTARGAVVLFNGTGEISSVVACDRLRGPAETVRVSRAVLERVRTECVAVVSNDISADSGLAQSQTLTERDVHSVVCTPLIIAGQVIGAIYLDNSDPRFFFDELHLQVMTAIAAVASLAVENLRYTQGLKQENQQLRAQLDFDYNMLGSSPCMREVFKFIRQVAPIDSTVLIQGESGTGKELVARAIHRNSSRADRPFVAINCAALAETLFESELFGHEKGAFTGAAAQKKGKIEVADGGTLFLDEVTELAPGLQAKLLRVLQEREFERVGGMRPLKLDIRLIAATNRNLSEAVKSGAFRNDLYYRLNVVALWMPPLRDRVEDIPLLAEHFIAKTARKCKIRIKPLSAEARACIMNYRWPGNVRELENAMERALVLGSSDTIRPDDLPEPVLESFSPKNSAGNYFGTIREHKKEVILEALRKANGNYIAAANALEMR